MMAFLADYEPVEDRLAKFWEDHPEGQIVTEMLPAPEGQFIVRASLWRDAVRVVVGDFLAHGDAEQIQMFGQPDATGLAQEVITEKGVNSKSALENCETSAIGRALANLGYAAKGKRASREEMEKATRDEPKEQTPWEWLWGELAIFKAWSTDIEKMKAVAVASKALAIHDPNVMERAEADRMLDHIRGQYETAEQGELPV